MKTDCEPARALTRVLLRVVSVGGSAAVGDHSAGVARGRSPLRVNHRVAVDVLTEVVAPSSLAYSQRRRFENRIAFYQRSLQIINKQNSLDCQGGGGGGCSYYSVSYANIL